MAYTVSAVHSVNPIDPLEGDGTAETSWFIYLGLSGTETPFEVLVV
jgi:hypothetical protein